MDNLKERSLIECLSFHIHIPSDTRFYDVCQETATILGWLLVPLVFLRKVSTPVPIFGFELPVLSSFFPRPLENVKKASAVGSARVLSARLRTSSFLLQDSVNSWCCLHQMAERHCTKDQDCFIAKLFVSLSKVQFSPPIPTKLWAVSSKALQVALT